MPPSPFATNTQIGGTFCCTFSAPVRAATMVSWEVLLPISFWITTQGLVFIISRPTLGSRLTSTTVPRETFPGISDLPSRRIQILSLSQDQERQNSGNPRPAPPQVYFSLVPRETSP